MDKNREDNILEKKCGKCELIKSIEEFSINRSSKDGYQNKCKGCNKEYKKKYREENRDIIKEKKKKYREENRDKLIKYSREWREENSEYNREWREENKEYLNEYRRNRISNDPLFKLKVRIRTLIWNSFRNGGYKKHSKSNNILGCSYEELLEHLNNNKYGFIYGDENFDIDHITPLSKATTKDEIIKLNHYTNLQLLPSEYNRYVKIDKDFDNECLEEWLLKNKFKWLK